MENGDFVIVFCATCLLLYVYYFFYIVILCCAFLTWCDVDVLLVGSGWLVPCVFCVVVAPNGLYFGFVAFGVCSVFGFGILMATILRCRGKR